MTLADGPADERVLFPEVENVVLVDPGRNDQQGRLADRLGRRLELDQFHQIVSENHLAGAFGDVDADLECVIVGHANIQPPGFLIQILMKILQAVDKILATGLGGRRQNLGICQHKIIGRQGFDELAGVEIDLLGILGIKPLNPGDGGLQPTGRQQVGLLDVIEDVVFIPGSILEASIAGFGGDGVLSFPAHHLRRRVLPQTGVILPKFHVGLHQLRRVGHQARRHFHERAADVQRIQ